MVDINKIVSIEELKKLDYKALNAQADLIRNFIIENVSHTGGHLSANLGVVEVTLALHYVFNSPKDKIIFDVGHQVYTHKILTGRKEEFKKLRQHDGLNGFPKMSESIHDVWETGHSSTSIGAAMGFLEAKKINTEIGEVVTLIGDGSIQNGLSLSALNYLASKKDQKVIIVLNDNEMSISKNVGGLSDLFNKIRIKKSYNFFKKLTPKFIRKTFKNLVYKNDNLFTNLGFKYFGPIDGHDIKSLIKYFEYAKNSKNSIILHVKTIKGKGYLPSELDSTGKWHGVGPFDISTGEQNKKTLPEYNTWSKSFGKILLEEVEKNDKIKIISPAMIYGSGLDEIANLKKDSIIDVGINEENACLMASSLSQTGLIPIVSIYSTFLQRAYDILNHDINRINSHVIFLIDRAGLVGGDGSTHQGIYDISLMSHLSNFVITMPRNLNQAKSLLQIAISENRPFAIRYPKGNICLENKMITETVKPYKWEEVLNISSKNVLTYGDDVNYFFEEISKSGKEIGLINCLFIKPLDKEMLYKLNNKEIIIYEQVVKNGSLGSLIKDFVNEEGLNINIKHYAIDDFVNLGTIEELKKDLGLDIKEIVEEL